MPGLRVLVTRPEPEAQDVAATLAQLGLVAVVAPLMQTRFLDGLAIAAGDFDAIVVTSKNGVRGLDRQVAAPALKDLPLYAVGDATARLAEALGFGRVSSAGGAVSDLVALVGKAATAGRKRLLYAAGQDRTGDLDLHLSDCGFTVTTVDVYKVDPVLFFPDDVTCMIANGDVDRVLIYSARSAETFVDLARKAGMLPVSQRLRFHAISTRAAEPLRQAGLVSVVVANHPDEAALLATLTTD